MHLLFGDGVAMPKVLQMQPSLPRPGAIRLTWRGAIALAVGGRLVRPWRCRATTDVAGDRQNPHSLKQNVLEPVHLSPKIGDCVKAYVRIAWWWWVFTVAMAGWMLSAVAPA